LEHYTKIVGAVLGRKIFKFIAYYLLGLMGLELLVLIDHVLFGSKEMLPSITEMIVVAIIFAVLIWREEPKGK